MDSLTITGYKLTTLRVLQSAIQVLEDQIGELAAEQKKLAATLWAEIGEEGERQGVAVPKGARAEIRRDGAVVTWEEAEEGD